MKSNCKRYVVAAMMATILPLSVHAQTKKGGSNGGGGNGTCGTLIEDNFREASELDGYAEYSEVQKMLSVVSPRFAARLAKVLLGLDWILTCTDLPNVGDDIGFLVDSEQVARQIKASVYIDQRKTSQPTFSQRAKAMLILHEALQYILVQRNETFKLGLNSAEIHERVRRVTFQIFAFHKRFKNGPSYSQYDLKRILAENDFGGWLMGYEQQAIIESIPVTVQKIAQNIEAACTAGSRIIEGKDLERFSKEISDSCRNCGMKELSELRVLFELNWSAQPNRRMTYIAQSGLRIESPTFTDSVGIGNGTCQKAKTLASPNPEAIERLANALTCKNWDILRNNCDTEEFSLMLHVSGASLNFSRK